MSHLVDGQINVYHIGRTIGHCTTDVGQLCTSKKINPVSKYKPFRYDAPNFASDQAQIAAAVTAKYGLTGPVFTSKAALFAGTPAGGAMNYNYVRPNVHFRERDFLGYFHRAQIPFMQAYGPSMTVDMLRDNPDNFPFYLLLNYTSPTTFTLSNRAFLKGGGINTRSTAVDAGDLDYNICVEDLTFDDGMGGNPLQLIDPSHQYQAYLCLVIDRGSGVEQIRYPEFLCSSPVTEQTQQDNDMWILDTSQISDVTTGVPIGQYPAVACAKITIENLDYYLPVYSRRSYPAKFTLDCGGLGNYKVVYMGISESPDGPFSTSTLTTRADDLYVKVRMYNKSGKQVVLHIRDNNVSHENAPKITLSTTVDASNIVIGGAAPVNPDAWHQGLLPTLDNDEHGDPVNPNSITIDADDHGDIVYLVKNIWSVDGGAHQPQLVESGTAVITPKLSFRDSANYYPLYDRSATYPTYTITNG